MPAALITAPRLAEHGDGGGNNKNAIHRTERDEQLETGAAAFGRQPSERTFVWLAFPLTLGVRTVHPAPSAKPGAVDVDDRLTTAAGHDGASITPRDGTTRRAWA